MQDIAQHNARINVGCGMNVVLNPLKMVLLKTETGPGPVIEISSV
jgi:hypothetical protein